MGPGEERVRQSVPAVGLDGLLEPLAGGGVVRLIEAVQVLPASAEEVPGLHAARVFAVDPRFLAFGELYAQGHDDPAGDLILQGEQLGHVPVVTLGPQVVSGQRVDKLGADAHLVGRLLDAALKHVADPQVLGHLLYFYRLVLVDEGRVAGDDEEARGLGERRDDSLGDAVGEILLPGVAAQIVEGQHRD